MTEPRPDALIGRILYQLRLANGQPTKLTHLGTVRSRCSALNRLRINYGFDIECTNKRAGTYRLVM